LSHQKKRVKSAIYNQIHGENLVKIGPVNPEIVLLKSLFEKEEINASKT